MRLNINIPEYKVSQFNKIFRDVIESNFDYIRIKGEISELKNASSGHLYLTLKDDNSVLNATIWKQKKNNLEIKPEVGMEVIVTGKISTYAKSISTYSINIDKLEIAGEGALLKIIEERKIKLKNQGFFDLDHKKNIPFLPNKIGVITSSTGSVIHDIINRIKDRFPTNIDLWPVPVQGVNAAEKIIEAIKGFNASDYLNKPDVIIIARGGGSTEDLMAFNDEELVKVIYHSNIPIISAIGHETDTTIIDYVSDLRASTPTAAAELAVPMYSELTSLIKNIDKKLNYFFDNRYDKLFLEFKNLKKFIKIPSLIVTPYKDKFNLLTNNLSKNIDSLLKNKSSNFTNLIHLLKSPENEIENINFKFKNTLKNFDRNINEISLISKKEFNKLSRLLESNSIHKNLKKGYSIIKKSKKIINTSKLINNNDKLNIQFSDKLLKVEIKKIN